MIISAPPPPNQKRPPPQTLSILNFIRVRLKMPLNSVHSYVWRGVQSSLLTSPAKVYTPSEHFPMLVRSMYNAICKG